MAAPAKKVTCLVCGGALERGFVLDRGESNRRHVQEWWSGDPESSFWMGIKKPEKRCKVDMCRCTKCGFLMGFGVEEATTWT